MYSWIWYRPKNLKVTDLCIYIDANKYEIKNSKEIADTIYNYIYLIVIAIAKKQAMFSTFNNNSTIYRDFSLYCAQDIFMTLKYQIEHDGEQQRRGNGYSNEVITPIKSILNYIKAIIVFRKQCFLRNEYNIISKKYLSKLGFTPDTYIELLKEDIINKNDKLSFNTVYTSAWIKDINKIIQDFLDHSLIEKNSQEWFNIKTSVLISILQTLNKGHTSIFLWDLPPNFRLFVKSLVIRCMKSKKHYEEFTNEDKINLSIAINNIFKNNTDNEDLDD